MANIIEHMSKGKIRRLVSWCAAHDWGQAALYNETTGMIDNLVCSSNLEGKARSVSFSCVDKLTSWAGY